MIEINGQTFNEGDTVRFERATIPEYRTREYTITAIDPTGIQVSERHFVYEYRAASAARCGITRTTADHSTEK